MGPIKEAVIKLVQSLPDGCTLEDIQYHLYVRQTVETGLMAIADGELVSEEEADRRISESLAHVGAEGTARKL